jgi:hypothetical protein
LKYCILACRIGFVYRRAYTYCKRAYGLGSQCRPNECLFWVWETPGGWISGRGGARWVDGGNARVSLRATQGRSGRILSQQGGFQVSGKGNKGSKGSKGIIVYITYLSYVYYGTNAVVNDTSCTLHNNNNQNECC